MNEGPRRRFSRTNYPLRFLSGAFQRIFVSRLPRPAETTIIIIPRRDFRNFIFPTFRDVLVLSAHETRPRNASSDSPCPCPRCTRNAHNYEHVTRLISCLVSLLYLDRPISSFHGVGSCTPIDARSTLTTSFSASYLVPRRLSRTWLLICKKRLYRYKGN